MIETFQRIGIDFTMYAVLFIACLVVIVASRASTRAAIIHPFRIIIAVCIVLYFVWLINRWRTEDRDKLGYKPSWRETLDRVHNPHKYY